MLNQIRSIQAPDHNPDKRECFGLEESVVGVDINDHCGP